MICRPCASFVGSDFTSFSGNLSVFLVHPLVELGLSGSLVESAFCYTTQEVFFVEHAFVRKDCATSIGGLCAFLQPVECPIGIQLDCSRIGIRVVSTKFFDELTIAWRPAICGNDVVEGVAFFTVACQTNFYRHCA